MLIWNIKQTPAHLLRPTISLCSLDLNEILSVSDRVIVMFNGRIIAERMTNETDVQELGLLMTGMGFGAILGSLTLAKMSSVKKKGLWIIGTGALWGALGLHRGPPY